MLTASGQAAGSAAGSGKKTESNTVSRPGQVKIHTHIVHMERRPAGAAQLLELPSYSSYSLVREAKNPVDRNAILVSVMGSV